MLAVAFDTLKLARKLESAGFPAKQAQDAAAALSESIAEWHSSGNLATKDDIQTLKVELLKWMFGQTLAIMGTVIAVIAFALHGVTK
jgi:hypothetical protein